MQGWGTAKIASSRTTLESKALNETNDQLASAYAFRGHAIFSAPQLNELSGIAAANRVFFGNLLTGPTGYVPTMSTADLTELAKAYYSGEKNSAQKFEELLQTMLQKYAPALNQKQRTDLASAIADHSLVKSIAANRETNQTLFEQKIEEYKPRLQAQIPQLLGDVSTLCAEWAELYRANYRLQMAETEATEELKAKKIAGAGTKIEQVLNEIHNTNHDIYALLTKLASTTSATLSLTTDTLDQESLQRIAQPINKDQRNTLFDLAEAAGFALSVINAVRSYYSAFQQSPAATQAAKIGMQDMVARLRSVDDLAKEKLKDLLKEDSEGKKLSAEEKRKKLREDAEQMLKEEEEGKKTAKKAPESADLEQATNIKSDMLQEARKIESARKSLTAKMPLDQAFRDPKFEEMFEQHRSEEVKDTRKYFESGMVPVKVLDAIANIRPPDVASYGPVSQLAILRAYRKTLQEYAQQAPKAM
jgi:hypothetical protein